MMKELATDVVVAAWIAAFTYTLSFAFGLAHVWPGTIITFIVALVLFRTVLR